MKELAETYRSLSIDALIESIKNQKSHLLTLRQQKTLGTLKGKEIGETRKNIARALTILTEKRTEEAVAKYKDAKFLPKDMRMKLTRSKRLALTRRQERKAVRKVRAKASTYRSVHFGYEE
ncbi:60S ribosomal protein L35 [Conglomerata obtusa]